MREDLDEWTRAIDDAMAAGMDPFTATITTDPRDLSREALQLSLDRD